MLSGGWTPLHVAALLNKKDVIKVGRMWYGSTKTLRRSRDIWVRNSQPSERPSLQDSLRPGEIQHRRSSSEERPIHKNPCCFAQLGELGIEDIECAWLETKPTNILQSGLINAMWKKLIQLFLDK